MFEYLVVKLRSGDRVGEQQPLSEALTKYGEKGWRLINIEEQSYTFERKI